MAGDHLDRFLKNRRGGRASETAGPTPGDGDVDGEATYRLENDPDIDAAVETPETVETRSGVSGDGLVETDHGCLVTISGGLATMLDLRFRDGRRQAFPYSYLSQASFDPAAGITLAFPSATATVTGRDLLAIYQAVTNQTAIAIVESPSGFDEGGEGSTFVEAINVGAAATP